jgi:benzaldehyde dehydrogenase (NAD)
VPGRERSFRTVGFLDQAANTPSPNRQPAACWAATSYEQRAAVLTKAGDLWARHADEVTTWVIREAGSIPPKANFEIHMATTECYEASALPSYPYGQLLRSAQPRLSFSRRLPVGVVGVIAPFNVPLVLSIRAVAPALALGNAVILKPDRAPVGDASNRRGAVSLLNQLESMISER